jgi:PspA associated protein B
VGFLDVIRGKRELAKPAPDRLFAMTTAYVTFETEMDLVSRGTAAIVFQPLATSDFNSIVKDMEEVVRATGGETGTTIETSDDKFGYRWMILRDDDFEDLVVGINAVSTALEGGGYGERILCAVFAFQEKDSKRPVYWIYNYKRGAFYPFVPAGTGQSRDNESELRLKAKMGPELPIEQELERWFPLWDIPI